MNFDYSKYRACDCRECERLDRQEIGDAILLAMAGIAFAIAVMIVFGVTP